MPSKKLPELQFAAVLAKKGRTYGVLSLNIGGKDYEYPIDRKTTLHLLASAAEAVVNLKDKK